MSESPQKTRQRINELLDELPPQILPSMEHLRFLRQQEPSTLGSGYPTVENPVSSLSAWLDLVPEGYDGDALADTEALYDEV